MDEYPEGQKTTTKNAAQLNMWAATGSIREIFTLILRGGVERSNDAMACAISTASCLPADSRIA